MNKLQKAVTAQFKANSDFKERTISLYDGIEVTIVHLDGLASGDKISQFVVQPILRFGGTCKTADDLIKHVIFSVNAQQVSTLQECKTAMLKGDTVLFISGKAGAITLDTVNDLGRTIAEPPTSGVVKGPREGFVENAKVNLMLLRKRLRTNELKTQMLTIGKYSNTTVFVCYLEGITDIKLVKNILSRLKKIQIDGILDSSYLTDYLSGGSGLFKQVGNSEKPDIIASKMLEGRAAIIVDGSPIILTLPYMFIEDLQSPEDYFISSPTATVSRGLRIFSAFVSIILPSLFVALQLYNYQIIPIKFLVTIKNSTEGIPFSPQAEMIIVLLLFDILREANSRMPRAAGLSLSLVGAIVLGDVAVKAGLLGAPAVVIGALSGIGLYSLPDNTLGFSLIRMIFTIIGGIAGIYGLMIALLVSFTFLVSMNKFGTPYLAPFAPIIAQDKKDAIVKGSISKSKTRPVAIGSKNKIRQGEYDD